jgi:hypothetical protein
LQEIAEDTKHTLSRTQGKTSDQDKMKTDISTSSGQYQFNRLRYGLSNLQSSFQRLMDIVMRDLSRTKRWIAELQKVELTCPNILKSLVDGSLKTVQGYAAAL